jgi:hypothetical protein
MDQFFFMADRHDPSFCAVRYMTDVRLREWKVYLQPVANRELLQCAWPAAVSTKLHQGGGTMLQHIAG